MTASGKYRLVVSDQVRFTVQLALLDGEQERVFSIKAKANRLPEGTTLAAAFKDAPVFADFLAARAFALVGWDGDSPLQDEAGQPAPADADALAALLGVQSVPRAFVDAYVDAIGGKAKLGN